MKLLSNPESLQYSAVDVFINHLPLFQQQQLQQLQRQRQQFVINVGYLGGPDLAEDILRAIGRRKCPTSELIMDIFTFTIIHSSKLIFPTLKYKNNENIPTLNQLETHLYYHGTYLTELSLANNYNNTEADEWLEVICEGCSSMLKSLTLPVHNNFSCITETGATALITKSDFANTLQELDLSCSVFSSKVVLFDILSHLPDLRKLNLTNVSMLDCGNDGYNQILPIPLDAYNNSLSRLEHLNMSSVHEFSRYNNCCDSQKLWFDIDRKVEQLEREWTVFFEKYTSLNELQIANTFITMDVESLRVLKDCLVKRKKPLAYLRTRAQSENCCETITSVDPSSRHRAISVIRQMNADRITVGETFDELLYELKRRDIDHFDRINKIHMFEVTRMLGQIDIENIDKEDILSAVNLLLLNGDSRNEVVMRECSRVMTFF